MSPILTIAGLTVREAVRRRLLAAFLVITVVIVGLSAWGFDHLVRSGDLTSGEQALVIPQALVLFMFMFSFVIALSASAIASPSISTEVESGVLMTVVARPVRRRDVLLGKWLGLGGLLALYAAAVCALEFWVVDLVSGFVPPNAAAVTVYLFAEGLLLLALALALSTRFSAIAAGVVGVAVFGAGWLAGVVGAVGVSLHIAALRTIGSIGHFIIPTDALWRGAIYYLEPTTVFSAEVRPGSGDPFLVLRAPTWPYLLWVAAWLVTVLLLGMVSFERREL